MHASQQRAASDLGVAARLHVGVEVVAFLLQLGDELFVARLEEMLEASLDLEELLQRQPLPLDLGHRPHAVDDLEQRPEAGLHSQAGNLDGFIAGDAPTARAGSEHVDEGGALRRKRLLCLGDEVFPVADRGLGDVGDVMGGHDAREVLAALLLALLGAANLAGSGPCAMRCSAGALDTGIHVGAVVVADIDHVVTALHGTGEALQADVVGAAVAAKAHELDLLIRGDLAGALEAVIGGLNTAQGCGAVGKGVVDEGRVPARVRIDRCGDLQATGGVGNNDVVVSRTQHDLAYRDACAAAATEAMAAAEALGQVRELFDACHFLLPFLLGAQVGDGCIHAACSDAFELAVDALHIGQGDVRTT